MTSLPKRNKVDVYRDGFSPQSTYFSIASRPSLVRQPMRNDFPLLACLELGARHVRLPLTDLEDPIQKAPIDLLRDEGVQITATWLWAERHDVALQVARHLDLVDDVEVQVPGAVLPPETCLRQIHRCAVEWHRPVTLATVIAREIVAGKQHPRTRIGYRAIDWVVDLAGADDRERLNRAAEAVFAGALLPKTRVFLDPLIDLDRTMDVIPGLLDRQCNPRPSFHAARCLNSILFGSPEPRILAAAPEVAGAPDERHLSVGGCLESKLQLVWRA